jgi:hypothetical protein
MYSGFSVNPVFAVFRGFPRFPGLVMMLRGPTGTSPEVPLRRRAPAFMGDYGIYSYGKYEYRIGPADLNGLLSCVFLAL